MLKYFPERTPDEIIRKFKEAEKCPSLWRQEAVSGRHLAMSRLPVLQFQDLVESSIQASQHLPSKGYFVTGLDYKPKWLCSESEVISVLMSQGSKTGPADADLASEDPTVSKKRRLNELSNKLEAVQGLISRTRSEIQEINK